MTKRRSIVTSFIRWITTERVEVPNLRDAHVAAFLKRRPHRWATPKERPTVRRFLAHVRARRMDAPAVAAPASPAEALAQRYVAFLRTERGLAENSILVYAPCARDFLAYMRQGTETGWDLWALPLSGDHKPFPVVQTRFDEGPGDFSPDGHWIAYSSNESGQTEVYVAPFPGPGTKVRVSTTGAGPAGKGLPRWRPDGKEIFYTGLAVRGPRDTDIRTLMAVPFQASDKAVSIGEGRILFRISLPPTDRAFYDVSADGQRFLVNTQEEEPPAPITLVVNWPALLKK